MKTFIAALALAASATASPAPSAEEITKPIEERQIAPRCPDNSPLLPPCIQWQIDGCMVGWEPWMNRSREEYLEWCWAMYGNSCTTRCYGDMPNALYPVDPDTTPWEIPSADCPAEGPEYQDCYDVGLEWCLGTTAWWRLNNHFCDEDCPGWCHEWMYKTCRRACNV